MLILKFEGYIHIKPFHCNVAFHIEAIHFICNTNQMTGSHSKCRAGIKSGNQYTDAKALNHSVRNICCLGCLI